MLYVIQFTYKGVPGDPLIFHSEEVARARLGVAHDEGYTRNATGGPMTLEEVVSGDLGTFTYLSKDSDGESELRFWKIVPE